MKLKIGNKLMLIGGAIVVVPFAVMGIIVSVRAQSGITDLVGANLTVLTTSMADYVENSLEGYKATSMAIAAAPDTSVCIEAYNRRDPRAVNLASGLSAHLDALGKTEIYSNRFNLINVVGADGRVLASSQASSVGTDVHDREYFQKAIAGETFISQMLISKVTGAATIVISTPVLGGGGKPIGVCTTSIKTSVLTDEMAKFVLGKTGYMAVVDRDGLFVLHPNKEYALKQNINEQRGAEALAAAALSGKTGIVSYSHEGTRRYASYAPVPSIGWVVIGQIPDKELLSTALEIQTLIISIALFAVALALVCLYLLARSISSSILACVKYAGLLAQGDLSREVRKQFIDRGDEIGDLAIAFRSMVQKFSQVVGDVQSATQSITQGSEGISQSAQTLSQGSTEQAASAEEVSSSVEEMAATIKQNSDNATVTERIANKAVQDIERGSEAVVKSTEAMKQIAEKVSIISEIARQTNMLALNAAIEAARAGESGKGFAVVASEVRKLAERSQKAAGEITELSTSTVATAQEAGKIIVDIVPDIKKTSDLVREIAAASREQSAGVDQIGKAMVQLDTVIQSNASASEEMASISEEFAAQAQQLASTVSFFKTTAGAQPASQPGGVPRTGGNAALPAPQERRKPKEGSRAAQPRPGSTKEPAAATSKAAGASTAIKAVGDKADSDFEEF